MISVSNDGARLPTAIETITRETNWIGDLIALDNGSIDGNRSRLDGPGRKKPMWRVVRHLCVPPSGDRPIIGLAEQLLQGEHGSRLEFVSEA